MLDTLNLSLLAAIGGLDYNVRQNVLIAFSVLMTIACIAIIIVIMMQKGTNDNVGVISGASDTFYGKHKKRDREGILKKITFGLFAFILVCAIICVVIGVVVD
ncbi:MAG: preprotein translocase subunit SecG [Clostridia bacterium]|nr:preprotein translocase subunit SecG [Clostridia bacterium]